MTEASSAGITTRDFGRYAPQPGPFARATAFIALIAEAFSEAQKMRREARLRYPHLSDEG